MSFVINVVIVPITPPLSIFGTLALENFAPLSPYRCLLLFSSSLLSLVSIALFINLKQVVVVFPGRGCHSGRVIIP